MDGLCKNSLRLLVVVASAEPAKSLVSATPAALEIELKTAANFGFCLRKKPLGSAISPGEKVLAVS